MDEIAKGNLQRQNETLQLIVNQLIGHITSVKASHDPLPNHKDGYVDGVHTSIAIVKQYIKSPNPDPS
jgi:hypothetical protein